MSIRVDYSVDRDDRSVQTGRPAMYICTQPQTSLEDEFVRFQCTSKRTSMLEENRIQDMKTTLSLLSRILINSNRHIWWAMDDSRYGTADQIQGSENSMR